MRSEVMQRIINEMEKDPWWVKLKRWMKVEWWFIVCKTRKYWDKEFINRRNHIAHWTIRTGTILKVFPGKRSHRKKPYKVIVECSHSYGFTTCLYNAQQEHVRGFYYDSKEWQTYHFNRFQIIKY